MIYIDFFIKETQERHFYKFEGDSFEITELHIGRNNYEWTGSERNETHTIPIRFTMKTNLGEEHRFEIDCGYTERSSISWIISCFEKKASTGFLPPRKCMIICG